MRRIKYHPYSSFLARVSSQPLDLLLSLPLNSDGLSRFVKKQWQDAFIRNAILLGSPDLYDTIEHQLAQGQSVRSGAAKSFLRYYLRQITRPTPFGLFAGVCSGSTASGERTGISLLPVEQSPVCFRFDMEFLGQVKDLIVRHPEVYRQLKFSVNTCLYRIGGEIRFLAATLDAQERNRYVLQSADEHPVLSEILGFCAHPVDYEDLAKKLMDNGLSSDDAIRFFESLVRSGILVSNAEMVLTGTEYGDVLFGLLNSSGSIHPFRDFLDGVSKMSSLQKVYDAEGLFTEAVRLAERMGITYRRKNLVRGDLLRSVSKAELSPDVCGKILLGIRIQKALCKRPVKDHLAEFRRSFKSRFGDQKVPLLQVMDQEFGTGLYGTIQQQHADVCDLLDDLPDAGRISPEPRPDRFPRNGCMQGSSNSPDYFEMSAADLKELKIHGGEWPDQLYALCSLSGSQSAPDITIHLSGEGHPGFLINRFGFLNDQGISEMLQLTMMDAELAGVGYDYAEIVHVPEAHTGNILQRKGSYHFEIPLMAGSMHPDERKILPKDILVSVRGDKVYLTNVMTGRYIIPTLTCAHNYAHRQLDIYEFLVRCGKQGREGVFRVPERAEHHWGKHPGIRHGGIVLRQPMWVFSAENLPFRKMKLADCYPSVRKWATAEGLPNPALLQYGESHHYVDWDNHLLVEMFCEIIRRLSIIEIVPFVFRDGSPVKEGDESYANEIIVCYRKE